MSNKANGETTHLEKNHTKGFNAGAVEHGACRKLNRVTTHKPSSAQPQGWQSKYPLAAWEQEGQYSSTLETTGTQSERGAGSCNQWACENVYFYSQCKSLREGKAHLKYLSIFKYI